MVAERNYTKALMDAEAEIIEAITDEIANIVVGPVGAEERSLDQARRYFWSLPRERQVQLMMQMSEAQMALLGIGPSREVTT